MQYRTQAQLEEVLSGYKIEGKFHKGYDPLLNQYDYQRFVDRVNIGSKRFEVRGQPFCCGYDEIGSFYNYGNPSWEDAIEYYLVRVKPTYLQCSVVNREHSTCCAELERVGFETYAHIPTRHLGSEYSIYLMKWEASQHKFSKEPIVKEPEVTDVEPIVEKETFVKVKPYYRIYEKRPNV